MSQVLNRLLERREALLAVVIIVTCIIFAVASPTFLSAAHLFGIARSTVVIGIMALGVMTVLLTNGIDISVSATAVAAMYVTTVTLRALDYQGPFIVAVLLAMLIGGLLGAINGVLVAFLRLPSMIVTIGTLTMYRGALLAFVGTERIHDLPAQMSEFSRSNLIQMQSVGRTVQLHTSVLLYVVLAILLALALTYVWWGRQIYAIGDNEEAAKRMGVRADAIRTSAFVVSGALAGLAGILYAAMNRAADPSTFVGTEMTVLAAVVLGGTSVMGGRGSVLGTFLGVLLITIVGSSLVLVGIPVAWQSLFVGAFLLFGVCVPAIRNRSIQRKRGLVVFE